MTDRSAVLLDSVADRVMEAWLKKFRWRERGAFRRGYADAAAGCYAAASERSDVRAAYRAGHDRRIGEATTLYDNAAR